jgi:hypothetical protein
MSESADVCPVRSSWTSGLGMRSPCPVMGESKWGVVGDLENGDTRMLTRWGLVSRFCFRWQANADWCCNRGKG